MKKALALAALVLIAPAAAHTAEPTAAAGDLPFVYTKWEQFTVEDGLPNDHIFAVKVDGPRVWVGTENGLALIDKPTSKVVKVWQEKDGLPFRAVTAIEVDKKTGDVWLGLFGGGLARLSGGSFEHWHQLNSGLVNDVVYGLALENDNVWCATTAGASRFNTKTGEWTIFTEKNAPMEEIWNYAANYAEGKVRLAVWGSGVLEYDVKTGNWKEYLDPDGEMEIDLYRDDGINHVITTGVSYVDGAMWVSTYFGGSRYDGRHWRGFAQQEGGLPSDFNNNIKARSANEAWYCSDKGVGALMDFPTDTWVQYTRGKAIVKREGEVLEEIQMPGGSVPHQFIISADIDGDDVWIGTGKGLGHGIGEGYYAGLRKRPALTRADAAPAALAAKADEPSLGAGSANGR